MRSSLSNLKHLDGSFDNLEHLDGGRNSSTAASNILTAWTMSYWKAFMSDWKTFVSD
jgi:hypothetical protein